MKNPFSKWFSQPERVISPTGRPLNVTVQDWFDPSNLDGWWARNQPEIHAAHIRRLRNEPEPKDPWGYETDSRDIRQKARNGHF